MQIDQYTYLDLSIFHTEEEFSVFHRLNFTRTSGGREWLLKFFREPFHDLNRIKQTQDCIRQILSKIDQWPMSITNGTLMVLDKFYDYQLDPLPKASDPVNSYSYRILHGPDFSMTRFSLPHFADFVRTLKQLIDIFGSADVPANMQLLLNRSKKLLSHKQVDEIAARQPGQLFSVRETIYFGHFFHERFRPHIDELMGVYGQMDAWYSMAIAMKTFSLSFPEIIEQDDPFIEAKGFYHLLLTNAVPYDITMTTESNFIFLTGANMAGKSTFIKTVGLAVFLAHIGLGVPATHMKLSLFNGILSNINVTDNLVRGESYFYNEVQRIKNTVTRINDGRKWLVLIDELFKGTNIQDAMKCSSTVIRGLINIPHALFILSTHLYEIGEELKSYGNISFKYFETEITDKQLRFSYQLKDGISNDRLGYLILQREGVVDLLDSIASGKQ
jgi:DNA mismatch repair ATPase MutS